MIAHVRRVWPGETITTIIVRDLAGGKESACFVPLPEGQRLVELCEAAAWTGRHQPQPLVLTLEPKTRWGFKITAAELLPETRHRSTYGETDYEALYTSDAPAPQGTLTDVQMDLDVARGKQWHDI